MSGRGRHLYVRDAEWDAWQTVAEMHGLSTARLVRQAVRAQHGDEIMEVEREREPDTKEGS